MSKQVSLSGKRIRLFFHTDIDGVISANLIKLFSGASIVELVPCPYQNYPKPKKNNPAVLDVFVDCRSRNRDEDIRIDHHASGEDETYLNREGIILDTSYKSAVSLVAHYLNIPVNKQVLLEMDFVDSGQPNVFSKFTFDNSSISKIMFTPGIDPRKYQHYDQFKDLLLSYMVKGWAIETEVDTPEGYERQLEEKFGIVVEDMKHTNGKLIKLVHSFVKEGLFREKVFTMTDSEFNGRVLPYIRQYYYEESIMDNLGVYIVVGFLARNSSFDSKLNTVISNTHPEPFQIFVSKGQKNADINIGELIQAAKNLTGITNGGGREDVGGLNTADKDKGIRALKFIVESIEKKYR